MLFKIKFKSSVGISIESRASILGLSKTLISANNSKYNNDAISFLEIATKELKKNINAWRLLEIAYGREKKYGKSLLAGAEKSLASGRNKDSYKKAIKALKLLKVNTPSYYRARDITILSDKKINYGYRLDPKYEKFLKSTFKKVHQFHAISNNIKGELSKIGVKKEKIIIIPNCTPLNKIDKIKEKKNKKKITLLTIGRYAIKKKGFDLIERITKKLNQIGDFKWIIIGRNTTELYKKKFIQENKNRFEIIEEIRNHDELFFPHTKLIKYYKRCHVYVNLSRVEGCPIVLLDALSSSLPIVSFNTRGGDEIVIDRKNGFIARNNDLDDIAKKILKTKKFKFKKNSKKVKKIKKYYDLKNNTKKIISNYLTVM